MSVRIIAGEKRGATLATPSGEATRPTLGRARESLFMILQYELPGARVLDLFAGCGALGLEALSRGASSAVFVENAPAALAALRGNIEKLGWGSRTLVRETDALAWLKRGPQGLAPFDLIFSDPPYSSGPGASLGIVAQDPAGWLAPQGVFMAQADAHEELPEAAGELACFRQCRYGATRIAFYRRLN